MRYIRYGSMTRVRLEAEPGSKTKWIIVRVWRKEPVFTYGPNDEVRQAILDGGTPNKIALRLDLLDGIAAYEIVDDDGNGALVGEWPIQ